MPNTRLSVLGRYSPPGSGNSWHRPGSLCRSLLCCLGQACCGDCKRQSLLGMGLSSMIPTQQKFWSIKRSFAMRAETLETSVANCPFLLISVCLQLVFTSNDLVLEAWTPRRCCCFRHRHTLNSVMSNLSVCLASLNRNTEDLVMLTVGILLWPSFYIK